MAILKHPSLLAFLFFLSSFLWPGLNVCGVGGTRPVIQLDVLHTCYNPQLTHPQKWEKTIGCISRIVVRIKADNRVRNAQLAQCLSIVPWKQHILLLSPPLSYVSVSLLYSPNGKCTFIFLSLRLIAVTTVFDQGGATEQERSLCLKAAARRVCTGTTHL